MLSSAARTLLQALFLDLSDHVHILTLHLGYAMSTSITHHGGVFDVEHPAVVERLHDALTLGGQGALILRSFTERVSHTEPNGVNIPVKQVRGWQLNRGALVPLDEAQMFDAHCTDSASGEPLPPERGVEYTGAPPIDLSGIQR